MTDNTKDDGAPVLYELRDSIAVITLNRPSHANAQNKELLLALDEAWDRAAQDINAKVIVLKANGKHFSAGHDMTTTPEQQQQWVADVKDSGISTLYDLERSLYLGLSRKWRDVPKPSIAVVQGACIAAGLMLCWPCDIILAADNTTFSDPVAMMGIGGVEYHGHTWELGARKAKEMLFTGAAIDAEEAHRLGMVNQVFALDELEAEAMKMAARIAKMPPFGVAMAKRAVNKTLDIMGQYAAIQSVFDSHSLGHGNATAQTGWPVLVDLEQLKNREK